MPIKSMKQTSKKGKQNTFIF